MCLPIRCVAYIKPTLDSEVFPQKLVYGPHIVVRLEIALFARLKEAAVFEQPDEESSLLRVQFVNALQKLKDGRDVADNVAVRH